MRHAVEWNQHAIARNRALTGLALGYTPEGPPDFGLDRAALGRAGGRALWRAAARHRARRQGMAGGELADAGGGARAPASIWWCRSAPRPSASARSRIAAATPRARVPDRAPLDQVARLIAGAAFVVGVDTGLLHLAAALGVPLVAIFTASEPGLTGPMGAGAIEVLGGEGRAAVGRRGGRGGRRGSERLSV